MESRKRTAITLMKRGKAPASDTVVIVMMTALDDFGIDKVIEVLNEICNKGEIPGRFRLINFHGVFIETGWERMLASLNNQLDETDNETNNRDSNESS